MRRSSWDDFLHEHAADIEPFMTSAAESQGRDSLLSAPDYIKDFFEERLLDSLAEYIASVSEEIVRTTGAYVADIRRIANKRATPAQLGLSSQHPAWAVKLDVQAKGGTLTIAQPPELSDVWQSILRSGWTRISRQRGSRSFLFRDFISELARACFNEIPLHTKYLPAARSGILQSHRALAGSLVRRSTLAGIEDLRVPALSGVVADFLSEMIELNPSPAGDFGEEALRLERDVLKGQIGLIGNKEASPEVIYQTTAGNYPLGRTSSMVSELAPVVLYLRHILRRGDLLVIEEPEAHLHPSTQVAFARSLVRLVNDNLRIVLTTHSEFFLQQINNAISASALKIPRSDARNTESLAVDNVSAYFFQPTPAGTIINDLPINRSEGIPDSSFSDVSERLYNEALILDRSIKHGQD
jgi:hypothetical protein